MYLWSEAATLEQASGDVVGEVAEAEGAAAQVLKPADGLGRAVAGAVPVAVGEDVGGSAVQGPAKRDELAQRSRGGVSPR